jgi:elongation factor Ts
VGSVMFLRDRNSYTRYKLGEGIEKKEDDFAAEVAALSK